MCISETEPEHDIVYNTMAIACLINCEVYRPETALHSELLCRFTSLALGSLTVCRPTRKNQCTKLALNQQNYRHNVLNFSNFPLLSWNITCSPPGTFQSIYISLSSRSAVQYTDNRYTTYIRPYLCQLFRYSRCQHDAWYNDSNDNNAQITNTSWCGRLNGRNTGTAQVTRSWAEAT